MANFNPGWNFNPANRAEICCDYMTNFSPGWNIMRAKSPRRMAPRTWIVKKIGALRLSQFGLLAVLDFQLFGMVTAYKMMELKRNLSLARHLSARKLAEFLAFLTAPYRALSLSRTWALSPSDCVKSTIEIHDKRMMSCETFIFIAQGIPCRNHQYSTYWVITWSS